MSIDPLHTQPPAGGQMSEAEYLRLDQTAFGARYEYLNGTARLMSGGSVEHVRIAFNMVSAIGDHLLSGPCTVWTSDIQVLIGIKANGKNHYVYPDATVSCDVADRRRGNKLIRSPRIVIEILSPGTEALDRGAKMAAYQACSTIQEIILVSQFARHVEIYRRPEEDGETSWTSTILNATDTVDLQSIDVQITMDEIYKGIDFDEPLIEE